MSEKWTTGDTILSIIFIIIVLALLAGFVGCTIDLKNDTKAYEYCLEQGIPADRSLTYMSGVSNGKILCIQRNDTITIIRPEDQ